jgi:hypothetical protein
MKYAFLFCTLIFSLASFAKVDVMTGQGNAGGFCQDDYCITSVATRAQVDAYVRARRECLMRNGEVISESGTCSYTACNPAYVVPGGMYPGKTISCHADCSLDCEID